MLGYVQDMYTMCVLARTETLVYPSMFEIWDCPLTFILKSGCRFISRMIKPAEAVAMETFCEKSNSKEEKLDDTGSCDNKSCRVSMSRKVKSNGSVEHVYHEQIVIKGPGNSIHDHSRSFLAQIYSIQMRVSAEASVRPGHK